MSSRKWIVLLGLTTACNGGPPESGTPPGPPRLSARPVLRVGSMQDTSAALPWFSALVVAPDGRLVTLHPEQHQLRVFAPDGTPLLTFGEEGDGPGELRGPQAMGFLGDTLWLLDSALDRFTLFTLEGRPRRTLDVSVTAENAPRPNGLLPDGTPWGTPPPTAADVVAGGGDERVAVRLDEQGNTIDTIARWSSANTSWVLRDPNRERAVYASRPQPFADAELVVVSRHRPEIVRVDRRAAPEPGIGRFRVSRISLDGDTIATRSFEVLATRIPTTLIDSYARAYASSLTRTAGSDALAGTAAQVQVRAERAMYRPPTIPPVSGIVLGNDGSIWLRRGTTAQPIVDWWVLGPDLEPFGTAALPSSLNAMAADRSHIWGLEVVDGAPYLAGYHVQ